jgi:hypothetical protein
MTEAEQIRLLFMAVGAIAGFLTTVLGFVLPIVHKSYSEVLRKGVAEWRANPWILAKVAVPVFGGLLLMFLSMQLARSFERTRAGLRRLLYGYTAVLDCLLLITILLLINLLPYTNVWPFGYLNKVSDWTRSRQYTLSPQSQEALSHLKEPVHVTILLNTQEPEDEVLAKNVEDLLQNCRNVNDQITFESLSPDFRPRAYSQLQQKVGADKFKDRYGLLIAYGGERPQYEFITRAEMMGGADPQRSRGQPAFVGESVLMKALDLLVNKGVKKKIYFTQGHGELSLHRSGSARGSADQLQQRLIGGNYDVRPLPFSGGSLNVPDDADLVVIAGPQEKFSNEEVTALRRYMDGDGAGKKGKLFILLDLVRENREAASTGLEPLLTGYAVQVDPRPLVSGADEESKDVTVFTAPEVIINQTPAAPIAMRFVQVEGDRRVSLRDFTFRNPRGIDPGQSDPRGARYRPTPFLFGELPGSSPRCVGVLVSETTGADPMNPHAGGGKSTPRLIVIGSTSWISDQGFQIKGPNHGDLFASCAALLCQREEFIGGTPPKPDEYIMETGGTTGGGIQRLLLLPGCLIILVVLALGGGVWLVRRR